MLVGILLIVVVPNGEVLSDGVIGEEWVGGEADRGDRVINEGN